MSKYDLVWANLSNPVNLAKVVAALEGEERQKYCDATASFNGWTALHYAAADGNKVMLSMLLRAGANRNAKSTKQFWYGVDYDVPRGSTPADVARICEQEEAWNATKHTRHEKTPAELAAERAAQAAAAAAPVDVRTLTVADLKEELRARQLQLTGKKRALVDRLQEAVEKAAAAAEEKKKKAAAAAASAAPATPASSAGAGSAAAAATPTDDADTRKRKADSPSAGGSIAASASASAAAPANSNSSHGDTSAGGQLKKARPSSPADS